MPIDNPSQILIQRGAELSTGHAAAQLSPMELIIHASPVVQFVMLLLAAMSVASWFIIGAKWLRFSRAASQSRSFLETFWDESEASAERGPSNETFSRLYSQVKRFKASPVAALYRAGYVELAKLINPRQENGADMSAAHIGNVERSLRRASVFELTRLETLLAFLATTGSVAPFVGLFGTVWGIMNSFLANQGEKSAGLDVVAPGIAEALIATAIGLAAAIPAVMAYNYFIRRLRVLESEMESFSQEYLKLIRRVFF